jgi:hypothetical protein
MTWSDHSHGCDSCVNRHHSPTIEKFGLQCCLSQIAWRSLAASHAAARAADHAARAASRAADRAQSHASSRAADHAARAASRASHAADRAQPTENNRSVRSSSTPGLVATQTSHSGRAVAHTSAIVLQFATAQSRSSRQAWCRSQKSSIEIITHPPSTEPPESARTPQRCRLDRQGIDHSPSKISFVILATTSATCGTIALPKHLSRSTLLGIP